MSRPRIIWGTRLLKGGDGSATNTKADPGLLEKATVDERGENKAGTQKPITRPANAWLTAEGSHCPSSEAAASEEFLRRATAE